MLPLLALYGRRVIEIVSLTRPLNAASPLLVVAMGGVLSGVAVGDVRLWIALAVLLLVHGAVTMANDIEDVAIDRRNHVKTILTDGTLSLGAARWWVIGQLVLGAGLAVWLPLPAIGAAVLLGMVGWFYNARPWVWSRRPLLSIVGLALSYGTLPLLLGAGVGTLSWELVGLALAWGVLRVSLSILKDYKDAVGDAKSNKRTFLLIFGHRWVRAVSGVTALVGVVAVLGLTFMALGGWGRLAYAIMAVLAGGCVIAWRQGLYRYDSYSALSRVFQQCGWVQLAFDGVCLLWLVQSVII